MSVKRLFASLVVAVVLAGTLLFGFSSQSAALEVPATRSLSIGDTTPGVTTDYIFNWEYVNPATVGSIRLQWCDNGFIEELPCTNPGGSFAAATLAGQVGETGFSVLSQSANEILLGRPPSLAGVGSVSYTLNNVDNPAGFSDGFFVRILIYPSADGTGAFTHGGSVLSATATPININSEVPPILVFCVGLIIDDYCATVTGNQIDYGDLFTTSTGFDTSQFGVATNASAGYSVTISGPTMTSGTRTIPAVNPTAASAIGTSQFGLNLRANTVPAVGQDPTGLGTATVGAGYNTPNFFRYVSGEAVASSVSSTLWNTFTVSYIINVSNTQASGIYSTTISYICTATF